MSLTEDVKEMAREAGFDLVGIAPVEPLVEAEQATLQRLRSGMLDGMGWITEDRVRLSCDPARLLPGARSLLVLGKHYLTSPSEPEGPSDPRGRIARYAHGDDYHDLFPPRMRRLAERMGRASGRSLSTRLFVDSSPLAEKAAALQSGIGWFGKNGCIVSLHHGSWVLLAEILSDLELETDPPISRDCGRCRLCIEGCPTGALVAPYVVDARRCISYLTIEHKGSIPPDLRSLLGDWIFGCDVCQEVCPHNRTAKPVDDPGFQARPGVGSSPVLAPLLDLDDPTYRGWFRGSPLLRPKRRGLLRNVAVALGNSGDLCAVPALGRALGDPEPLIRSHAAWALGRIGGERARKELERARETEPDVTARAEIVGALAGT